MEATDVKKKLIEMLRSFDTVMVTTHATDNKTMHSRPMAIAEVDDAGEVWFVTQKEADKVDESKVDQRAVLTAQGKGAYVSLSGKIDLLVDRERIRALWNEGWRAWFPKGPDDREIALWRLRPEIGEYWDNRGMLGAKYLFDVAKALLDGRAADVAKEHAKVPM
jgi:general stress protein 26